MGKEVQAILNLLNEGVVVEGDIQTPRDIRIVGTVRTDGRLVLGPSSRVSGKVNSPNIDVFGNVEGDIVSTGIVVLRAKSNVKGTISAATMVVEVGAVFNGECSMVVSAKGIGRPETAEKK